MNLIELSQRTNRSMDDLKEILMIQFNRIILSEYIDLDEEILQKLMGYLNISQTDPAGSQEISDDFMEQRMKNSVLRNCLISFIRK